MPGRMSPPRYREARQRRLRIIAAVLVTCLVGPIAFAAVQAAAGFGAASIVLSVIGFSVIAYVLAGRE
ncbi:MAG: hypothetical protein ABIM89_07275 [Mycobacteriales bacterium]